MVSSTEGSMLQMKLLGTIFIASRDSLQEGYRDAKSSCGEGDWMS